LHALPVADTGEKFQGFQAITFAPSDPEIVYGGFGLWRNTPTANPNVIATILLSSDGGHTWTHVIGTALDGYTVTEFVVHQANADIAWASTLGAGIFRTEDRGQTWSAVNSGLGSKFFMTLAGDAQNPDILYAGSVDRGVYKSEDRGGSWRSISYGMDANEPVYALAVDPLRPDVIYAGSVGSGLFLSEDGGARWRLINTGLLTRAVNSLAISADGETLYAGTYGGGVFRLSTHDQAYFNSLVPTPTPSSTPRPVPPTSTPGSAAASTPTSDSPSSPLCGAAALVPLGLLLLARPRRKPAR
jgi:hypothetical protein